MRRIALAAGLLAVALPATAHAAEGRPLGPEAATEIARLQALSPFDQGRWGILVDDTAGPGQPLFQQSPDVPLEAASTTKNVTVSAALENLGPGHRVRTVLRRDRGGRLILVAAGDLTLGGRRTANGELAHTNIDHTYANALSGATLTPQDPLAGLRRLARGARRAGVRQVTDVVVDDRLWKTVVLGGEVVSPIAVNENVVDVLVRPTRPGRRARLEVRPRPAGWKVVNRTRTTRGGPQDDVEVEQRDGGRTIVVTGTIPSTREPLLRIGAVADPPAFARTLLIQELRRAGVRVAARATGRNPRGVLPARAVVARLPRVATLVSAPYREWARLILKTSHNPGANMTALLLAVHAGGRTNAAGVAAMRRFALKAGMPADQIVLRDGRGLSGNLISPRAHVALLRYDARQPWFRWFFRGLPIQGVDEIPEEGADPAKGHVRAKSGTQIVPGTATPLVLEAKTAAGYVDAPNGARLAYAAMVNDVPLVDADGRSLTEGPDPNRAIFDFAAGAVHLLEQVATAIYVSQAG